MCGETWFKTKWAKVARQFRPFHLKNKGIPHSFFIFRPFLYTAFFICSRFCTLGLTNSRRARNSLIRFVRSNFFLKRFKARSMLSPSFTGIESMSSKLGRKQFILKYGKQRITSRLYKLGER